MSLKFRQNGRYIEKEMETPFLLRFPRKRDKLSFQFHRYRIERQLSSKRQIPQSQEFVLKKEKKQGIRVLVACSALSENEQKEQNGPLRGRSTTFSEDYLGRDDIWRAFAVFAQNVHPLRGSIKYTIRNDRYFARVLRK